MMSELAVWKFKVSMASKSEIAMPYDAKILSVQAQNEQPCIWALVHPDAPMEIRTFRLIGTGHPVEKRELTFIGTFQLNGGIFVGHLFEVEP